MLVQIQPQDRCPLPGVLHVGPSGVQLVCYCPVAALAPTGDIPNKAAGTVGQDNTDHNICVASAGRGF